MVRLLYGLSAILTAINAIPAWDIDDTYISSVLEDQDRELLIQNVLRLPTNFPNLPPIIAKPKSKERTLKDGEIPQYVLDYSPYVYLYLEERYLPYDIKDFVTNLHAEWRNGSIINGTENGCNISTLGNLPPSKKIYLTSNSDFTLDPEWITGSKNKPLVIDGEIKDAPATLIVVDKGNGWVDSFWFYFYSFNLGPFVLGSGPYGNHVGDWEHLLVRFYKGKPMIVWISAHGGGGAYYYHNLEKLQVEPDHPIIFLARGTHANYVSVGQHPHDLPYDILLDFTDRGPLWSPVRNYLGYTYHNKRVFPSKTNAQAHHVGRELEYGNWLAFRGCWGDKQLPLLDPRQSYLIIAGYHQIDGPTGPLLKNLLRLAPCERGKWWNFWQGCNIRANIKWGVGVELEGWNCGNIFVKVKPKWLRQLLNRLTWGGGFCWVVDLVYG